MDDPAAHSFGGRNTPRTEVMFGRPGLSYVYFVYGMHHCFNVVTMPEGTPEAVLLRAVAPLEGIEYMRRKLQRPGYDDHQLANGPGKLCQALELNSAHNRIDLANSETLWLESTLPWDNTQEVIEGARVGIGDRHDAVHWPLRFALRAHPALSPPKFTNYLD